MLLQIVRALGAMGRVERVSGGGRAAARSRRFFEELEARTLLSAALGVTGNSTAIAFNDATPARGDYTDYAQINVAGTVTRTYTLTNTGNAALNFSGGAAVSFSGANAGDFQVVAQPSGSLGAGLSTAVTVSFTPGAAGLRRATINIATNDPTNPQFHFAIQGTGLNASAVSGAPGLLVATTQAGSGNAMLNGNQINVLYTGYLLDGTVFDASSLHGNVPFGFSIGFSNVIQGWQLGFPGAQVGESRTLIIPASLGYGSTAQSNIPANSTLIFETTVVSVDGPYIAVSGKSTAIGAGDATPSAADDTAFGSVATGGTATHTFTITSAGIGTLRFLGSPNRATLGGVNANQFSITQPAINQAGTAAEFTVTYSPTGRGNHTATITIPTNDPANPNFTFTVGGSSLATVNAAFDGSLVIPASVAAGTVFNVPLSIHDTGGAPATGAVNIQVRASTDAIWDNSDTPLGSVSNFALNVGVGGATLANIGATIPAGLPGGSYYLLARITPVNAGDGDLASNVATTAAGALAVTADGPDLTVTLGSLLPAFATYVPGDTVKIPVTITNTGDQPAAASKLQPIFVDLRTADSAVFNSDDPQLAPTVQFTKPLGLGASATVVVTFKIPVNFVPGTTFINAKVDPTNLVAERDESNNTTDAATPVSLAVAYSFGSIGRAGSVPLTILDANGTKTTFKISGPGTGEITVDGGKYALALTGTTVKSSLTITTAKASSFGDDGRFTLDSLTIGDGNTPASLNGLTAKTTDLKGGILLSGSAKTISLGSIDGGVGHAGLTFAGAVGTLTVAGNMANVLLTAPALGKVTVAGDMTSTQIQLTQAVAAGVKVLTSLTAGNISHSQIRAVGNLGAITALTLVDSLIFAGVNDGVSTRPGVGDFVSADAAALPTIVSVTLKGVSAVPAGAVLTNSQVAAGAIGTVKLPKGVTAIGDLDGLAALFGFTTRVAAVKSYTGPATLGDFVGGKDAVVL